MDAPTCGKGLAAHAPLPEKIGELTAAVAAVLEHHITSLDPTDPDSRRERDAYTALAGQHRQTAGLLAETARQMTGYANLPMGQHDEAVLSTPRAVALFATFVELEQELTTLLQQRLEVDREMLRMMKGAS